MTFGGLTTGPTPVPDPATHVEFRGDVSVNGGAGADTLFNRNATLVPPAALTTTSIDEGYRRPPETPGSSSGE